MLSCSFRQQKILQQLYEHAPTGNMLNHHAAGLVSKNRIVAIGTNNYRSYINGQQVTSTHAEIDALHKYVRQFRQCKLSCPQAE